MKLKLKTDFCCLNPKTKKVQMIEAGTTIDAGEISEDFKKFPLVFEPVENEKKPKNDPK